MFQLLQHPFYWTWQIPYGSPHAAATVYFLCSFDHIPKLVLLFHKTMWTLCPAFMAFYSSFLCYIPTSYITRIADIRACWSRTRAHLAQFPISHSGPPDASGTCNFLCTFLKSLTFNIFRSLTLHSKPQWGSNNKKIYKDVLLQRSTKEQFEEHTDGGSHHSTRAMLLLYQVWSESLFLA